jgi:hypothetical protein
MQSNITTVDKAAMAISGGLMLLGIVVLGFLEVLDGEPFGAAPMTNEAGEVIATPMFDPALRTGLVILGLVVLLLWGLYRYAATSREEAAAVATEVTAD